MLGLLAILIAIATISDIVGQNICQVSDANLTNT